MTYRSFAYPLALVFAGCFSSAGKGDGDGIDRQSAPLARGATHRADTDPTHPYFVQAQPGARCTFHHPGDAAGAEVVRADEDGKAYFYPPPDSWGSAVDVDCTGGSSKKHVSIDLNDRSTFQVDGALAQQTRPTSVRPALTGNLDAIPMADLLRRGYPPRPDAQRSPERYKRWVEIVSAPRVARSLKMIKALGRKAGNYVGTVTDTQEITNAWSGRAMDVYGWTGTSDADFPIKPNNNDASWYVQYDTYMTVPSQVGCARNDNCYAAAWAGMGGMEARDGLTDGSLVQSGVYVTNINGAVSETLFAEYAPNAPLLALPDSISIHPGDSIEAWGWVSSDSSCADINTNSWTPVGCFSFYNITTGEYQGAAPYDLDPPDYTVFYGWTYESIVEDQENLGGLANFGSVFFNDYTYTADGYNDDAFTDPWIYINSSDSIPSRLIAQIPSSTDDAWEYEVDWVAYR